MASHGWEVERQHLQVGQRLFPRHASPCQRQEGVEQQETDEWRQYALESVAIELRHRSTSLDRYQQECRHNDKQGYCHTTEASVVEGYPESVALIGQHRYVASQSRCVGSIEILAGVDQHDHEAGDDTDVVHKYNSLVHFLLTIICDVNWTVIIPFRGRERCNPCGWQRPRQECQ